MIMKEAPEKIYLTKNLLGELRDGWCDTELTLPEGMGQIEYIRADAFIEKACEFIETYPHLFMGVLRSEVIEDFKNYMKGE